MTEAECNELVRKTGAQVGIGNAITAAFCKDVYRESEGHPYVVKVLVGEAADGKSVRRIERIVAGKDDLLDALFERTREYGFATKQEAIDAEAKRRIEEQEKEERVDAGSPVAAPLPKTLATLLEEFFREHVDKKLAPKTRERYQEQAAILDDGLLAMPLTEIKAMHLNREWNRLLESGGHHRKTKEPRPLSKKTVRNIAGVLSSAFKYAMKSEIVAKNPVLTSEPPVPKKCKGIGLGMAQTDLLIEATGGPWCMPMFLEMNYALGARRGEVLALRWSDIANGYATIARSLSQSKQEGLVVKAVKGHESTEEQRAVKVPEETLAKLAVHRKCQDEFRKQFGPDYAAQPVAHLESNRLVFGPERDLIFANPDGTPLKPDSISATVSALFKRLKIQKPKGGALHLLRHTMASQMLDGGVPLPAISARLGHSSIRTTAEIYAHAIHGSEDEAVRRWEEYQQRNRVGNQPTKGVQ
jgi:integrase